MSPSGQVTSHMNLPLATPQHPILHHRMHSSGGLCLCLILASFSCSHKQPGFLLFLFLLLNYYFVLFYLCGTGV
jgi:hypothetical protein